MKLRDVLINEAKEEKDLKHHCMRTNNQIGAAYHQGKQAAFERCIEYLTTPSVYNLELE